MKKQRRQQFDGGGGGHNDPTAAYYSRHSSHLPSRDPAHAVPDHATSATAAAAALNSQPQISSSRELSTANDNYDFTSNNGNRKYSHRRSHRYKYYTVAESNFQTNFFDLKSACHPPIIF